MLENDKQREENRRATQTAAYVSSSHMYLNPRAADYQTRPVAEEITRPPPRPQEPLWTFPLVSLDIIGEEACKSSEVSDGAGQSSSAHCRDLQPPPGDAGTERTDVFIGAGLVLSLFFVGFLCGFSWNRSLLVLSHVRDRASSGQPSGVLSCLCRLLAHRGTYRTNVHAAARSRPYSRTQAPLASNRRAGSDGRPRSLFVRGDWAILIIAVRVCVRCLL